MEKEITVQRVWLEGLLEHGRMLNKAVQECPSDIIENHRITEEIYSTIGYINSVEMILK